MASRIQGLTVEIGGDTVKLQTALKDVDKQIKSTQAELKDVNRLLKLDPSNTELLSQKQKLLAEAVTGTKERLDKLKTAYEAALKDPNYDPKALDAMQREIVETESNLKSLEKQSDQVARQMLVIDGSGAVQSKFVEIDKALSSTQSELKKVEEALKLDPGNVELVKQKQELLTTAVSQSKEKVEEMKAAYDRAAKDPNFDKSSLEALEKEIDAAEKELKELEEQAKSSKSTLDKIGEAREKLQSFGKKATEVGQTVTDKLTTPIIDFGKSAVETTMNFDATMSEVAAIAGATGSDLEDLRAKAKEMGATTKFSASEAAEAMTYMGMAGWDTKQILDGIPGIMNLASASGTDLAVTSDIVTDALTAFGRGADEAGKFADILAATSSGANTNVEMLGESFKYVGALAGSMNYTVQDVSIALGIMANSGIKASQAGTTLSNIITRMVAPTKESGTAMSALGLSLIDSEGNMKSFRQVMDDLREAFKDCNIDLDTYNQGLEALDLQYNESEITLEEYEKRLDDLAEAAFGNADAHAAQYAKMLAGQRGLPGLLSIVGTTEEEYQKLTEAIDTASDSFEYNGQVFEGQAAKMSAVMLDNLKGDSTILQSSFEALSISIGEVLTPILRDLVGVVQKVLDWLNSLDEGTKSIVVWSAAAVAAIGPVITAFGLFTQGLGAILGLATKLSGAFGVIKTALGGLKTLVSGLFSLIAAHPIIATITAIVAAVIYLWNNCEEFRDGVIALWTAISEWTTKTWQGICEGVSKAWDALCKDVESIGKFFTDCWNGICSYCQSVWNSICEAVQGFVDDFRKCWDGICDFCQNIWDSICEGAQGFVDAFMDCWNSICDFCSTTWDIICKVVTIGFGLLASLFDAALQIILLPWTFLWENVKDYVFAAWDIVTKFLSDTWENISKTASEAWKQITDFFSKTWEAISSKAQEIWKAIVDFFTKTWESIRAKCEEIFNKIKEFFQKVWDSVSKTVSDIWKKITDYFSKTWDSIKKKCEEVFNAIKDFFQKTWDAVSKTISDAWKKITDFFTKTWDSIKKKCEEIFNAIKDFFQKTWDAISNKIKEIWNAISNFFSNTWNQIKNTATNIFENIKSTITNVFNTVMSTVENIWNNISNFFSNTWNQIKNTAANIFEGIKNAITGPIENAKNIIGNIVETIKGFFSNFNIQLPHIKLPHFSINPPGWQIGDLLEGSIPSLGIEWYAKGGILDGAQIFGAQGNTLLGGGEAGKEAVLPLSELWKQMESMMEASQPDLSPIEQMMSVLVSNSTKVIVLDTGALVGQLTPSMNKSLAKVSRLEGRR